LPLITIMPDGGNYHWFNYNQQERIEDFLIADLLPACADFFPIRPGRWAIGGASMGGYGAMRLGLKYPDCFASVIAHAGGFHDRAFLDENATQITEEQRQDADVFAHATAAATATNRPHLRFDCGLDDPLLARNRAFHQHLLALGYPHDYAEFPGGHTAEYFDERVRDAPKRHLAVLDRDHAAA
jgi:S-formylglutathione hydrolase FrmB